MRELIKTSMLEDDVLICAIAERRYECGENYDERIILGV